MLTKDEMWERFLEQHEEMSMEDLKDIRGFAEMFFDMGEVSGMEKSLETMKKVNQTTTELINGLFK